MPVTLEITLCSFLKLLAYGEISDKENELHERLLFKCGRTSMKFMIHLACCFVQSNPVTGNE